MASAPSLKRGKLRETLVHGLLTVNLPAAVIESFAALPLLINSVGCCQLQYIVHTVMEGGHLDHSHDSFSL